MAQSDYEQFKDDARRIWHQARIWLVVLVLVVIGVLIYNDSKRDTCGEQGKDTTGGLIVSCKDGE